ncbi:hypothetical protein Tco_0898087 [Tanacetum coccineum]
MANLKYCDKHNMVAFLKKPTESTCFTEIVDFLKGTTLRYALTYNPPIYDSLVKQFWQTATVRTLADRTQQLIASIDNKDYTITEAYVRSDYVPLLPAMLAGAAQDQGEGSAIPAGSQTPLDHDPSTSPPPIPTTDEPLQPPSPPRSPSPSRSHETSPQEEAQGWKIQDLDDDPLISLMQDFVTPTKATVSTQGEEHVEDISPTTLKAAKTLSKVASQKTKSVDKGKRYKRRKVSKGKDISTGLDIDEDINTGFEDINTGFEEFNTGSLGVSTGSGLVSTSSTKVSIPSSDKGQRDRKAPMIIEETQAPKRTKEQIQQEEASLAEAIRLQTLEEEETAKQHYTEEDWDAIKAKLEANAELTKTIIGKDLSEEDFAKRMVDLVNQRKKYFAEERAKAKRSKPMTQSQLKTYMKNYLKNQGTWKLTQLKKLTFEEVKEEFDKLVKQVSTFVPMSLKAIKEKVDEEKEIEPVKKIRKRRKRIVRKGLHTAKGEAEKDEASKKDDLSSGTNVPINHVPVAVKPPSIASYNIIKQGKKGVYQIVRENGTDKVYISFGAMLKEISRDDLTELYRIMMKRYGTDEPTDEYKRVFWGNLKTMFDAPLSTDLVWSIPERRYPLSANLCQTMLNKKLQGGKENEDCYQLLKMMEKQAGIR